MFGRESCMRSELHFRMKTLLEEVTANLVVSSCTGTQRKETLTNCVITPCMVMKTKGIPSCTGTPGQPREFGLLDFLADIYNVSCYLFKCLSDIFNRSNNSESSFYTNSPSLLSRNAF